MTLIKRYETTKTGNYVANYIEEEYLCDNCNGYGVIQTDFKGFMDYFMNEDWYIRSLKKEKSKEIFKEVRKYLKSFREPLKIRNELSFYYYIPCEECGGEGIYSILK